MPKTRELSHDERLAIKYLRESRLSFRKIGEQLSCHYSTALRIYKQFVSSGCVEKKARSGRPNKINERGERIVCRAVKQLRFGTLNAIIEDVRKSEIYKSATRYIVRKILHKYKFLVIKENENLSFLLKTAGPVCSGYRHILNGPSTTGKMLYFQTSVVLGFKMTQEH